MPKNKNKAFVLQSTSNGTELVLGSGLERSFVVQFRFRSVGFLLAYLNMPTSPPPPPPPHHHHYHYHCAASVSLFILS